MSWGECGTKPGQFNLVHNLTCDPDGWVYVADRENHRIQVFDGNGKYETQYNNLHRPCALFQPYCSCPICYVGELGPATRTNRNYPNLGPRLSIIDHKGNLLARIGGLLPGIAPDEYMGPHGLTVDSHGDIYIAEVSHTQWKQYFPDEPMPPDLRVIRKLRKLG
jgi:hypothetical protein